MSKKTIRVLPLNRVEGDLELKLEIEDRVVTDVQSIGTMYRGIENILVGRALMDGLVITPRICGICSTAHLAAAAKALDMLYGAQVPDNGLRVRNVSLMVEQLQNDLRHTFLIFMPDFTRNSYSSADWHAEAVKRYTPLKGRTFLQVVQETKKILEIIAILGGQWPHSTFMVPGGVVSIASAADIIQCRLLLDTFRSWYERRILGCKLERWQAVTSLTELDRWLAESDAHRQSDLGTFLHIVRASGSGDLGSGCGNFISSGSFDIPADTAVQPVNGSDTLFPAGFATGSQTAPFDQANISEEIGSSWLTGYNGGRHPFEGLTQPESPAAESDKYSWIKSVRYDGRPAETGPLADMINSGNPLFVDVVAQTGPNVFARQLARLVRPAVIMPALDTWLREIGESGAEFFREYRYEEEGQGYGLVQAHRGLLGHWVKASEGKITAYQVITPTAWNAAPMDSSGQKGPWEQAIIGTPVKDPAAPVEVEHVIRSFDPCLVCAVHCIEGRHLGKKGQSFLTRV
jgi:hydrogenase large subunit